MQYLTNINLTQNELQNAIIQNVSSTADITTPKKGQICYATGTNKLYYFNDSVWLDLSSDVNTTYTQAAASTTGGANLTLSGSDSSTDSIKFASGGATTVTSGDANTITITSANDNTTYSHKVASVTNGASIDLDAGGSGTGTDSISILGSGAVGIVRTDADTITITGTDTNTTYSQKVTDTAGVITLDLDAGGSGTGTDSITLAGAGATAVTRTDANTVTITSTNTDTTYSAGNGLGLSTTTFSVDPYTTAELTASTMGEIGVDATGVYVKLGTTNKTAAPGNHTHSTDHTQGTDTGTTSDTFTIDYDNAGAGVNTTLAFNRGTADSGDAALTWNETYDRFEFTSSGSTLGDLRLGNLTVEGTVTQINSNEVNIGDSQIVLNADITTSVGNSNGGVAVKRLMADDTTRKDAEINYNVTSDKWETVSGAITGTLITAAIANKVSASLTGAATSYVVTHNLNSRDLSVTVRETGSPYAVVMPDIEMTTLNTLTVKFAVAPTSDQYTVIIVG